MDGTGLGGPRGAALNRNDALRDEILGVSALRYSGGIKPFRGLDAERLQRLIDARLIDPLARRGQGPEAWHFLRFLRRWPCARAHGYATSRRRPDYGVVLEGLECDLRDMPESDAQRLRWEFEQLCRHADEYSDEGPWLFAWWDGPR